MKGFIVIEEFQSLKGLEIEVLNTAKMDGAFYFEVGLRNNNPHSILTSHVSKPVLAVMQNRIEIASIPLAFSLTNQKIEPEEKVTISITASEEKIDADFPITFYTRTKEIIRGEITSIHIN